MTFECKLCGSNLEPNGQFCAECGLSKDAPEGIKLGKTCCRCHVNLPTSKKNYVLSESSGCLRYDFDYCEECYEAKLIEQAKWKQIYEAEEKAAKAACHNCRKPFPGIFRKKRFTVDALNLAGLVRDYYCEDCFIALPKSEILDKKKDFFTSDPWA